MGACTCSTCPGSKKRQYFCTRSSSSSSGLSKAKRQCSTTSEESQTNHPDWSDIASDVLEHIYRWLPLADIHRCRAVCSWWRCISQTHISSSLTTTTPPPILWHQPYLNYQYLFLDLAKVATAGKFYLPNNHEWKQSLGQMKRCVGYSFGYFLSASENNRLCLRRLNLSSPIKTLGFPPISVPGKNIWFEKAVLWADPMLDTSRCGVVVVPYNEQQLMFAKCGDTRFSKLECQEPNRTPCTEIICINNRVYGISCGRNINDHHMEAWDCCEDGPKKVLDFQPTFSPGSAPPKYHSLHLVESRGELLLVAIKRPNGSAARFFIKYPACKVYKMDFKENKWVHMDSLGDEALFIFKNQTMCLSTREFPQYEKNTIYFRHYSLSSYSNPRLGVFNMEDGSFKEIYLEGQTIDLL